MRKEIIDFINRNQELKQFIREQPQWYRTLSRYPEKYRQCKLHPCITIEGRFHIR